MALRSCFRWLVGTVILIVGIAIYSGRFGLWTPPMMLLGPLLLPLLK